MDSNQEDICLCRVIHHERINQARKEALKEGELEKTVQLFKAMADHTRCRILWALTEVEMCVCDLAALLGITESAVSHQLRLLRQLQLVTNRRQGAILYYRLNDHHVHQLISVALEHIRE
ncbi:MAG: transcriptional regulator [Deltaproteobacteria bacterium RIFOXYD12_FULL_50_9]|nr:MAG: transcriptional regulator [Deltaproteobacteria bacterium RIFOXYD12_FULL_50_9]